jgi:hypothetical protein
MVEGYLWSAIRCCWENGSSQLGHIGRGKLTILFLCRCVPCPITAENQAFGHKPPPAGASAVGLVIGRQTCLSAGTKNDREKTQSWERQVQSVSGFLPDLIMPDHPGKFKWQALI